MRREGNRREEWEKKGAKEVATLRTTTEEVVWTDEVNNTSLNIQSGNAVTFKHDKCDYGTASEKGMRQHKTDDIDDNTSAIHNQHMEDALRVKYDQ